MKNPLEKPLSREGGGNALRMKNLILCLSVIGMMLMGCSKDQEQDNDGLPDPNDVCSGIKDVMFRQYCYFYYDTDRNGAVSKAEAEAVRSMSLSILEVKTLGGVGWFPNLQFINCTNCKELAAVDLSKNRKLTSISDHAFQACSSLTDIRLPNTVTVIKYGAFEDCSSLPAITLPEGVVSIGEHAFLNCSSLVKISIPESVTSIAGKAFLNCSNLASITIPDGVTLIESNVFENCSSLVDVTLSKNIDHIGDYAFASCISLRNIELPDAVATIGEYGFAYCTKLSNIIIPENVTSIGRGAFETCRLLKSIHCKPVNPPALGAAAFDKLPDDCKIYVPIASVDAYKAKWNKYSRLIVGI